MQVVAPAILRLLVLIALLPSVHAQIAARMVGMRKGDGSSRRENLLIKPGVSIGDLRIGDPVQRVASFFDKMKPEVSACGEMFSEVVESKPAGNLIAYVKDGHVFQIDSGTPRFHTADGIAADDRPEKVRAHYKHLHAYADDLTSMALGDRPVVYWIDTDRGIAFEFAYFPEEHRRYLYSVIVFRPHGLFCPMGEQVDASHWHELLPYSLEPPDRTTRRQQGIMLAGYFAEVR